VSASSAGRSTLVSPSILFLIILDRCEVIHGLSQPSANRHAHDADVPSSSHLDIGKVHLRVLLLELVEDVELLLLVARGLAGLLLALVVHHLLDHPPCLAVEVAELAVLGLDLAGVDLGSRGDDVRPPLHLVLLVQVDLEVLAGGGGSEGPGGVVDADAVGQLALCMSAVCEEEGYGRGLHQ
jgi:hypothetical protein